MRDFLIKVFGTTELGIEIGLFSIWHFLYIFLIAGAIVGAAFALRKRNDETKKKVLNIIAIVTLCLYIVDFFLQPFVTSDHELNIDKLPFHICTLMGIVAVFAQYSKKEWFKELSVALAIAGSLMYLTYPGSALGGGKSPWCYKVIQTMVYHGMLLGWGVLNLTTKQVKLNWKNIWMSLVGILVITVWAAIGNFCYNEHWAYGSPHFDWFFITGSTFPFVPTALMPFAVIVAVFGVIACVYLIYWLATRDWKKNKTDTVTTENE